jgi:hypothetical protein
MAILGSLLVLVLAWLLFRHADPRDEDVWEGVALGITAESLDDHGQDAAQDLADLWQLDAERERAMRDE